MKRILALFMVFALGAALLAGCDGGGKNGKNEKDAARLDANAAALGKKVAEATTFSDHMSVADKDIMLAMYGIDESLVEDAYFYISTGATAEEVAVIVCKTENNAVDQDSMNEIMSALDARVQSQRDGFTDYVPEELAKLSSPAMMMMRNVAFLLIADDTSRGIKAFEQYFVELDGEK